MADEALKDWTTDVERSIAELARMDLTRLLNQLVQAGRDMVTTSDGNVPGNWEPNFVWAVHRVIAAAALVGATCELINGTKWQ